MVQDPNWQKKCLDAWLEYGSATKAAPSLGVSANTIQWNGWQYLIFHPDEARVVISGEAEKHPVKAYQDKYRNMNDKEFWSYLTARAVQKLSATKFVIWVETFHPEQYEGVSEIYKSRYPNVYAKYH